MKKNKDQSTKKQTKLDREKVETICIMIAVGILLIVAIVIIILGAGFDVIANPAAAK